MSTVSIRLPDDLLKETESRAKILHIPRAEYIRRAIVAMNHEMVAQKRRERLMKISRLTSTESNKVNAEFDRIEGDFSA
jgi:metal-responsive CopG/Arc/MetJ family transcriptional regulator